MPETSNQQDITAKLFDPLGLILLVMVVGSVTNALAGTVPKQVPMQDQKFRLQKWMTDLERVDNVRVNRYYFPGQKTKVKSAVLHGFGDASKGAYCAVV